MRSLSFSGRLQIDNEHSAVAVSSHHRVLATSREAKWQNDARRSSVSKFAAIDGSRVKSTGVFSSRTAESRVVCLFMTIAAINLFEQFIR